MQQGFTTRRKLHEHFAMIVISVPATQSALVNETVYELHGAVMAKAELLGKCGNRWTSPPGQALNSQEKLMLLGLDPFASGLRLR